MGRPTAALLLAGLALLLAWPVLAPAQPASFPDVPPTHPYWEAVAHLADLRVVEGFPDGSFGPERSVLRQQFAKMIVLALQVAVSEGDACPYPDVQESGPDSLYPDNYVAAASREGITLGKTPTSFAPFDQISRFQVITMVVRAANELHPGLLTPPPSGFVGTWAGTPSPDHQENARWAESNGLLAVLGWDPAHPQGNLSALDPWAPMPRGEVAQVLHNLLLKLSPGPTTTTGGPTTTEPEEVFEEHPRWNLPDLALTSLHVEPERASAGEAVTVRAGVANVGTGEAAPAVIEVYVDDLLVEELPVDALLPQDSWSGEIHWTAQGPGRHLVRATVRTTQGVDRTLDNQRADGAVWVAGEADPEPFIDVIAPDLERMQLVPGETRTLPFLIRNPSFAQVRNLRVTVSIDDEVIRDDYLEHLPPGGVVPLDVAWVNPGAGYHRVTVHPQLPTDPEDPPEFSLRWMKSLAVIVLPGTTVLYPTPQKDKWASLGPTHLTNGDGFAPDGSSGIMTCLAFDPTNTLTMYAGAQHGGVWKTVDGGKRWTPCGDKLPSLHILSIAVDPKNPKHVYVGTHDLGVFKSVDGGATWTQFATRYVDPTGVERDIRHVWHMALTYPGAYQLVVYLGTSDGLLRCSLSDPAKTITAAPWWTLSKRGFIRDLKVSPANSQHVYLSVEVEGTRFDGVYRTTVAATAGESDWQRLTKGLEALQGRPAGPRLEIYPSKPDILYATTHYPKVGVGLDLYKSTDRGDSWTLVKHIPWDEDDKDSIRDMYNPFVRVQPNNQQTVYLAGVGLWRLDLTADRIQLITGLHADQQAFAFVPGDPTHYYALNDGGVWRGAVNGAPPNDAMEPRNGELRTFEFYDLDCSGGNSKLMIGGTQDNGTLLWEGQPTWRHIRGGDGNFALIAKQNDSFMYSQNQFLDTTELSNDGGTEWQPASVGLPTGKPWYVSEAFITIDPADTRHLLAQGDVVWETKSGGQMNLFVGDLGWLAVPWGSTSTQVRGYVTRIAFQPSKRPSRWVAGTSQGQLWYWMGSSWRIAPLWEHPHRARLRSLAFAPTNPNVFYALFEGVGSGSYLRVHRFDMSWGFIHETITWDLPTNIDAQVICGDPYNDRIAYVGTKTGVYRGDGTSGTWKWKPYNDGLPLVEIRDLLVDPTSKELRAGTYGRGAWAVRTGP